MQSFAGPGGALAGGWKITRLGGEAEWLGAEKKKQQKRRPAGANAGGGGSGHLRAQIM